MADMNGLGYAEMKRLVDLAADDAVLLRSMASEVEPLIPAVVQRFYEQLLDHPDARTVFTEGESQIERLKGLIARWLLNLFCGRYDDAYFEQQLAIGVAHVRVGLAQQYMVLGIELLRQELEIQFRRTNVAEIDRKLRALDKVLTLNLAVMLESYKERYSDRIRRSERSALEEQLTRAEHLAEIGKLAASLAHEIKNPLAGISGAIQVMRDGMTPSDPHHGIVTEILAQINRLDATVKDLLIYARPTKPRRKRVSLHTVVTRVMTLLRQEPAFQRVSLAYDAPPADVSVDADEAHVEQLLMNLVINAAHASSDGQTVRIEVSGDSRDGQARLTVTDKGVGMPKHIRDQAFEPFFTTKAKGTGLGLAICQSLATANEGTIELQSEVGEGTRVVVSLPRRSLRATAGAER